jgi:hypothetical protein
MSAINSFATSATLKTRQSGKHLTYSEQMRSVSSKSPKTSLPLKRTSTMASSSTQSSRRPASKVDIGNASSVKLPAKKRKNVLQSDFEEMSPTELPVIVIPDHKTRAPKKSSAKLVAGQEEESMAITLLRAQIQSLLEKDSKKDNEALVTHRGNERNLASENEALRKQITQFQTNMRKIEDDAKVREKELRETAQREKDEGINAIAERLKVETQRREEKEREESKKQEIDDALFKQREEIEAKAKRELEEFKAKQEEITVKMTRELDESNHKKDVDLEKASSQLKELKAKQEEDEARTRRDQVEANNLIEQKKAQKKAKKRADRHNKEIIEQNERHHQEAIRIKYEEIDAALQLKHDIQRKKAKKKDKIKRQLLKSKREEEERDKGRQEEQRLKNLRNELQMQADFELKQVQILQMRDEVKEKERRRLQLEDDEHQTQRTNKEIMRRMGLVNVGKAEYELDAKRKNLFEN